MDQYAYDPSGYREWFINSLRWDSGDTNKPTVISNAVINDVAAVTVLEAQIPYTFYTISQYNCNLYMRERATGGAAPAPTDAYTTIPLPLGNYNSGNIGSTITSAIAAAGLTGAYSCTFTTSTGKLTLSCSNKQFDLLTAIPTAQDFTITPSYLPNACLSPIGLEYYNRVNYLNVTSVTFPHVVSLSGPSWVMIRGTFGIGSADNLVLCDDGTIQNLGNVMACIPVNCVPGSTINWRNNAPRGGFYSVSSNTISSGTFWLTSGDDDTPLDLNGAPFQFKLGMMVKGQQPSSYVGRGITQSGIY